MVLLNSQAVDLAKRYLQAMLARDMIAMTVLEKAQYQTDMDTVVNELGAGGYEIKVVHTGFGTKFSITLSQVKTFEATRLGPGFTLREVVTPIF